MAGNNATGAKTWFYVAFNVQHHTSAAKGKMTLFRDDCLADFGAIVFSILNIAIIVVMTMK